MVKAQFSVNILSNSKLFHLKQHPCKPDITELFSSCCVDFIPIFLTAQTELSSPHPVALSDHHSSQPAYKLSHSHTLKLWQRQCYSEMHKNVNKCTCLFYCYKLYTIFCWRISYIIVQVTEKPYSSHQLLITQFNYDHVLNLCIFSLGIVLYIFW
jgi:hypothetical protein